jgi:aerobic carbon-monoxide dehydrogenase medium subunit
MKSAAFDYARPKELSEAMKILGTEKDARPAAGTQSLGPMLNLRMVQPKLLVNLLAIDELKAVHEDTLSVTLGSCITHADIEDGRVPAPTGGFMRTVAANIAYRAVRNRGTIGGSLAHADPAADWPSALLALGAIAIMASLKGRREVPLDKFLTGVFETALTPQELLVAIRIPKRSRRARYGYWKLCRKAGEFAQAIGAAVHDPETNEARAVMGATGAAPHLVSNAGSLFAERHDKAFLLAAEAAGLGGDAYNCQIHAVALQRACARLAQ